MYLNNIFDIVYQLEDCELFDIKNKVENKKVGNILNFKKTILEQFCLYFFKDSSNYLSCCLLKKNFLVKYNTWIIDKIKVITIIHFDKSFIIKKDQNTDIKNIHHIKNFFLYNDSDVSLNERQHNMFNTYFDINNNSLIDLLKDYNSGYHINFRDISWETVLCYFIYNNIGLPDKNDLFFYNYKKFKEENIINFLYENNENNEKNKINVSKYQFICDICIYKFNQNDMIYTNCSLGMICKTCYLKKKRVYIDNKKSLIKKFLLNHKQNLFQKKLNETKLFLKNYNFNS